MPLPATTGVTRLLRSGFAAYPSSSSIATSCTGRPTLLRAKLSSLKNRKLKFQFTNSPRYNTSLPNKSHYKSCWQRYYMHSAMSTTASTSISGITAADVDAKGVVAASSTTAISTADTWQPSCGRDPIATVGESVESVGTPALLLDVGVMQRNIDKLTSRVHSSNVQYGGKVAVRPHAKAFKSSSLLRAHLLQHFDRFCAQTVQEAEMLVRGGCRDILLTNQVTCPKKLARLVKLAVRARAVSNGGEFKLGVLVDCAAHIEALEAACANGAAAAAAAATTTTNTSATKTTTGGATAVDVVDTTSAHVLHAWIEVDAGQARCGVPVDSATGAVSPLVVDLARAINESPHLIWGGLQCYHGAIQHVRDPHERRKLVLEGPVARAARARDMLVAAKLPPPEISGGGTGTHEFEMEGGVHTEIQPGSFLFLDRDYGANQDEVGSKFAHSLFVHARVVSSNEAAGRRVLDAGAKACDLLSGPPSLASVGNCLGLGPGSPLAKADLKFTNGGDEHGIISGVPSGCLGVGSAVQLIPSHCDPCVNQHAQFIAIQDGVVQAIHDIDARGPGW